MSDRTTKTFCRKQRSLVLIAICAVCFFCMAIPEVQAQMVEMSSSLNPVGSGARALGMGGAFIGVADDATAASWNPAGLVQLEEPEVSLVYAGQSREQTYHSTLHPEIDGTNRMDTNGLNYASIAYPFELFSRTMIVSLNYQRLYDMDKKVRCRYDWLDAGAGFSMNETVDFKQKGSLYAISPAMAVQVMPDLYVGVTLNFWNDYLGTNGWKSVYQSHGTGSFGVIPIQDDTEWQERIDFKGNNAHLGIMGNLTDSMTIGIVYKTAFEADLTKERFFTQQQIFGSPPPTVSSEHTVQHLAMMMPASYGIGFQYRHSDRLTLALDVYRTQWSRFFLKDESGNEINPISGDPLSYGRLRNTTQLRMGTEYLFIGNNRTLAVRGGLFYDPEPGIGKLDDYYGFSLGSGYSTPRFSLDASYQYRRGKNVDGDLASVQQSSADIVQQTMMLSGILYF